MSENSKGLRYGFIAFDTVESATRCYKELNEQKVPPDIRIRLGYAEQRRNYTPDRKSVSLFRRRKLSPRWYIGTTEDEGRKAIEEQWKPVPSKKYGELFRQEYYALLERQKAVEREEKEKKRKAHRETGH